MGTTPTLGLPYPELSDTADVPRDVKALAVKLDEFRTLGVVPVSVLPAGPFDGQEVYLQAPGMATPPLWHMRFSSSVGKWHFLGGAPVTLSPTNLNVPALGGSWVFLTGDAVWPVFRGGLYRIQGRMEFLVNASAVVQLIWALHNAAGTYVGSAKGICSAYAPTGVTVHVSGENFQGFASASPANNLRFACTAPGFSPAAEVGGVQIQITPIHLDAS